MSYLLPQFKCLPDTFSFHSKTHVPPTTQLTKGREPIHFRTQCVLSTTSPPTCTTKTTVLDLEKLQFLSLEARSNPAADDVVDQPWAYIDTTTPPTEAIYGSSLATETLFRSEEAITAAAAAEAVALAKAAVKVAKQAAMIASNNSLTKSNTVPYATNTFLSDRTQLEQIGPVSVSGESTAAEIEWGEKIPLQYPFKETDSLEPTSEELELLHAQISASIAVRSKRQKERKVRRARAAEKAASNVVSIKSGSTSRRKRATLQDVDHSDPLRYLRATTSASRLLTANEEQKLSEGIQDLLKLENSVTNLLNVVVLSPHLHSGLLQQVLTRKL